MKITKLEVDNFKRLRAVRITPEGGAVVLGGQNGAGKSSVLDAIEAALGGAKHAPEEPVRKGSKGARVVLETEDFTVTRKWPAKGSPTLELKAKNGGAYGSPQTMLDGLMGSLSFDPLAFSRMPAKEQAETLRKLVGLDFASEDKLRAEAFEKRTDVGRELRRLQGALEKMPEVVGKVPAAEVSVSELAGELERRRQVNAANAARRADLDKMRDMAEAEQAYVQKLEADLAAARAAFAAMMEKGKAAAAAVTALVDEDVAEVKARIDGAEESNRTARLAAEREKLEAALERSTDESEKLTAYLAQLDQVKAEAATQAKYPVPGLVVTDAGVELAGVPFEQASQAEKLRASVAIGLALNKDLKVLLIRDGALLDAKSLALVAQMAADAGGQVWLEVVGNREEVTVLISDGEVSDPDTRQPAAGVA